MRRPFPHADDEPGGRFFFVLHCLAVVWALRFFFSIGRTSATVGFLLEVVTLTFGVPQLHFLPKFTHTATYPLSFGGLMSGVAPHASAMCPIPFLSLEGSR